VIEAFPNSTIWENVCLATVMELYRFNVAKHGRWSSSLASFPPFPRGSVSSNVGINGSGARSVESKEGEARRRRSKSRTKSKRSSDERRRRRKASPAPRQSGLVEEEEEEEEGGAGGGETQDNGVEAAAAAAGTGAGARRESGKRGENSKSSTLRIANSKGKKTQQQQQHEHEHEQERKKAGPTQEELKQAKEMARNKNKIQRPASDTDTTCALDSSASTPLSKRRIHIADDHSAGVADASPFSSPSKGCRRTLASSLTSHRLRTFDDEWLSPECLSDELFLTVVRSCTVQEIILGAESARAAVPRRRASTSPSASLLNAIKRRRGSHQHGSDESLVGLNRRESSRSIGSVDDVDLVQLLAGRNPLASTSVSMMSSSVLGPQSPGVPLASMTRTVPSRQGSINVGGQASSASPAISVDALQRAAMSGCLGELAHLTLKRYEVF